MKLAPFPGDWPIEDSDTGWRHDPAALGLPADLLSRINAFEQATLAATDVNHENGPTVTDVAAYDRLAKEAEAIATALKAHWPDKSVSWLLPGH
ncbi:MAG: hypothetical protein ACRCYS_05035 [Beijerinckiaceae bacterium]